MKKAILILITAVASVFLIASCGKKLAPSVSGGKIKRGFDSATYDYVYVEAIKQKLMGNGGEALGYLEHCIKINPNSDAAYYQMAQIVASNGDLVNGKKYLSKALEIQPENVWYLTMLSSLYYQSKNIDSAIVYYEKAVKAFPDKENLQLNLGKLYSENQNYSEAVSILDELDKKYGVNETSTLLAIRNLMASGRYNEAEVKTRMLLEDNPDEVIFNGLLAEVFQGKGDNTSAMEVYTSLIERNPENPSVQLSLCNFLINSKRYDDLFTLLNTVSLNENIEREEKLSLFVRILETEEIISSKGENLLMSLLVLEASYPSDDIIPLLRVDLLLKGNKIREAGIRLEDIIKKRPENYYAWEKLLLVYLQEKDYIMLQKRGDEAATLFNMSYVAKILYANGAMENKNYKVALEELRKATILASDDKDMNIQILTMKADIYYRMDDFNKAFETFEEAMKINSEDLTIINNYAYYLAEQNMRLKEAEDMSEKVIEAERSNVSFLDTYGWILYKRGKLKAAGKIMDEIISGNETPGAEIYEHYGYILKKQKKWEKAIQNWEIAMKLDTTKNNLIIEIENCLRER